jgi:hypothetical protein
MNPLQRAAFRRKVYYLAAILALFTGSMLWRGIIPIPLSDLARAPANRAQSAANWVAGKSILNQSLALDLRELEQGETELSGEGVRLGLVGSRGFVVTFLWYRAIDAQKRNDFHKMEDHIRWVTELQPHFITPWIFQSWNIAYNVSVEMHGSGDMYYYIARGIELLAEGERRNSHVVREPGGGERRLGSPDMRYQIGFYYQNKFGVSDQVEVLRCLYQLSCIPPDKRNPDALLDPKTGAVDPKAFENFCREHPHLVRRLRGEDRRAAEADPRSRQKVQEALKCPKPEDIVQFLRDNRDVPSRYKSATELADADKQFPALPPPFSENEAHPGMGTAPDNFTAFKAARAWYAYGMVPLPPHPVDANNNPIPAPAPSLDEIDQLRYRLPRSPMLILFRQGAPRAQSFQAELEQKEGWFDNEGWRIDDPRDPDPRNWWFPDPAAPPGSPRPLDVVVGRGEAWSLVEWQKAAEMWQTHGYRYALELSAERLGAYERATKEAPAGYPGNLPADVREHPAAQAASALYFYRLNRGVTNFPFFLASAEGESRLVRDVPVTVRARKALWAAEQARKLGNKPLAIRLYAGEYDEKGQLIKPGGLQLWKEVLAGDRAFHRPERGEKTEEETYTYELAYLRLLIEEERVWDKANQIADPARAVVPFFTHPFPLTLKRSRVAANEEVARAFRAVVPFAPDALFPRPFPGAAADDPPAAPPQWSKDAREEIKWYVAEKFFSPFAGVMDEKDGVSDDRKGTPWVRPDIKESVRVQLGIQRARTDQQPRPEGPPGVTTPRVGEP